VNKEMMKFIKLTALIIWLIGIAYIAYGSFAIYVASQNIDDLPAKILHDVNVTGVSWLEWKNSFLRGGIFAISMGTLAGAVGTGIFRAKEWGRTVWSILSPILLLSQFSEAQKSLTHFNSWGHYQFAFDLFILIALTWVILLLPSSRREFVENTEQPAPQDR
jgi:hypothetical protein